MNLVHIPRACGSVHFGAITRHQFLQSTATRTSAAHTAGDAVDNLKHTQSDGGMKAGSGRKLRILCVHGYQQSGEIFSTRIGSLRKALKSRAEFIFIDAPQIAEPEPVKAGDTSERPVGRTWWTWEDDNLLRPSRAVHYTGWPLSLAALTGALQQHAPIDGILGFSQGATATALLLSELTQRSGQLPALQFAIMIAGFMPYDKAMREQISEAQSATPSLFVWGSADQLVPAARSKQLSAAFAAATTQTFEHGGAHMVPSCSGEFKATMISFLDQFTLQSGP